jgi:HlyD family secretion protein
MKNSSLSYAWLLLFLSASCGDNTNTEGSIENQGKVKKETVSVVPKLAGRILQINVTEGQAVHKGDTLAVLDVPEISSKLQQAEGAISSAQGQLNLALNGATGEQVDQLQGQIDAANAQLQFAEESFQRMQNMYKDSLISAQQFGEVRSKYMAAQAQVRALQAKDRELKKGARPENIQAARGQVQRAVGARNEVLQAQKERYIIAPADMVIESIALQPGELATPGYTIFTGFQSGTTYFRFTVSESKVNAFQLNQPVNVKVPYINKTIPAKVISVKQLPKYAENTSTSPNYKLGESIFELKVVPTDEQGASELYANSTVLLETNRKQ